MSGDDERVGHHDRGDRQAQCARHCSLPVGGDDSGAIRQARNVVAGSPTMPSTQPSGAISQPTAAITMQIAAATTAPMREARPAIDAGFGLSRWLRPADVGRQDGASIVRPDRTGSSSSVSSVLL